MSEDKLANKDFVNTKSDPKKGSKSPAIKIQPPNYTQTPNELFDHWLPFLDEIQLKVLLTIIRKTFGWYKVKEKILLPHLQKTTGFTQVNIIHAITSLRKKGIITKKVIGDFEEQFAYYEVMLKEDSNNSYIIPKNWHEKERKKKLKDLFKDQEEVTNG